MCKKGNKIKRKHPQLRIIHIERHDVKIIYFNIFQVEKIAEYYAANYPTELVFKKYREKKSGKKPTSQKKKQPPKPVDAKPEPPAQQKTPSETQPTKTSPASGLPVKNTEQKPSSKTEGKPSSTEKGKTPEKPSSTGKQTAAKKADGEEASQDSAERTKKEEGINTDGSKTGAPEQTGKTTGTLPTPAGNTSTPTQSTAAGNESPTTKRKGKIVPQNDHEGKKIPTYDTAKYNPEGHSYGTHTAGGGVEIPKYQKENYDKERQKQELAEATARGKITLLKDHSFHWSDEHKSRMKLSVFDRLQGGKKKAQAQQESQDKGKQKKAPAKAAQNTSKQRPEVMKTSQDTQKARQEVTQKPEQELTLTSEDTPK